MYKSIPSELKQLKQWCCFKLQSRGDKLTKIPIDANTGGPGKSNDENTWSDFQTAFDSVDRYQCDGIGFYFKPPYFGIDLDNVEKEIQQYQNEEHDNNIVSEFIETIGSYAEYSISGNGIHIIAKGELPKGGRRKGNIEMYDSGRFFVMTGKIASSYIDISNDKEGKIKYLHSKYIAKNEVPKKKIWNQ